MPWTQAGADLEARDKQGWTALFHATASGHQNMVKFLLDNGADTEAAYVLCVFGAIYLYTIFDHRLVDIIDQAELAFISKTPLKSRMRLDTL